MHSIITDGVQIEILKHRKIQQVDAILKLIYLIMINYFMII